MAIPRVASDMAQFFDFGEAAVADVSDQAAENALAALTTRAGCSVHGNEECLCLSPQNDIAHQEGVEDRVTQPEFNTDFSSWIPRYHKPAQPCEYCRSKSLECFIYDNSRGDTVSKCSPCNALFRPCSFSEPEMMPSRMSRTALDTLDVVNEQTECTLGGITGRKQMRSLGHVGPIMNEDTGDGPKKGAAAARFPRAWIKVLKEWMITHIDHPYPTDEEKEALKAQTGMTISQISNWMANTRRRQKARPKRSSSPSIRPSTEAIDIPAGRTWDDLNPFERWKHSPPENEPAPMTAIAQAVENLDLPVPSSSSGSYQKGSSSITSNSNFSALRAPSTTSLETGFTQMSSGSHNSAWSHGSRNSFSSLNSLKSKERRRRRRLPTRAPKVDADATSRLFQCTFCCDRFKNKYDWSRHEKSLHLSLEKWICAPLGQVITVSSTGQRQCVYCDVIDPSKEHLDTHEYRACEDKGLEARTFYRKDHLRQHLRLMHGCKMTPSMEKWKSEAQVINSRCGFCATTFTKWQDRVDHLAKEFRNGATMKDWKGCRGLDPHVAAHVVNAMPPYLIANESKSPYPFSASNASSIKSHNMDLEQADLEYLIPVEGCPAPTLTNDGMFVQYDGSLSGSSVSPINGRKNASLSTSPQPHPNATCWEILTLRLGRFARQHIEQHGANTITDKMLQEQAREILYESDDPWEQTAADNPEWLNLFKKAHGIDNTETRAWKHQDIFEDLGLQPDAQLDRSFNLSNFGADQSSVRQNYFVDVREDVGLDPNAQVDSSFDLTHFPVVTQPPMTAQAIALAYECTLSGTLNMSMAGHHVSGGNTPLTASTSTSQSTPGSLNHLPTTFLDLTNNLDDPIGEYACTKEPGGICLGEGGELAYTVHERECARIGSTNYLLPSPTTTTTAMSMPPPLLPTASSSLQPTANSSLQSQDPFGLASWDQNFGTSLPHSTAGLSASVPVSSIMGLNTQTSMAVFGGNSMAWDDSELDFALDMDMDIDFNTSADMDLTGLDDLLM